MPPTATETERVVNPAATTAAPGTDTLVPSLNGDYLRGVSALWRVARMALGYRVRFPAAVLAVIGAAVFQLLIPRFLGRAIDEATGLLAGAHGSSAAAIETAQGALMTAELARNHPRLAGHDPRWLLIDTADRVLPGLAESLSRTADRVLRRRGVDIRTKTSVAEATDDAVRLSDGTVVPTRSLIWCVGVRPEPLVESLGLPTNRGRLVVDEFLAVPGRPDLWACGDVAAVPDLTRPGEITAMTAQHAQRQGKCAGDNIAATFGRGARRPYKHHDLGFVVDLAGFQAAANPLQVPLSGILAKVVTRGYHLFSLPGNRWRTAADWLTEAILPRQAVQLGLVRPADVPLDTEKPARLITE